MDGECSQAMQNERERLALAQEEEEEAFRTELSLVGKLGFE